MQKCKEHGNLVNSKEIVQKKQFSGKCEQAT